MEKVLDFRGNGKKGAGVIILLDHILLIPVTARSILYENVEITGRQEPVN